MTTTNMAQTMRSRDEGEQGEHEEMKNEVSQDAIWSKYAGTVEKMITTAAEESKNRQAMVGPQAKASGTAREALKTKVILAREMVSTTHE